MVGAGSTGHYVCAAAADDRVVSAANRDCVDAASTVTVRLPVSVPAATTAAAQRHRRSRRTREGQCISGKRGGIDRHRSSAPLAVIEVAAEPVVIAIASSEALPVVTSATRSKNPPRYCRPAR